ncbi:MAG: ABC transporter substrate-binding protein [Steroidobacteraceae bacterium]
MENIRVTFACELHDYILPLYLGDVQPEGIDLKIRAFASAREIFDRMGSGLEFDIAVFSSSEFICRHAAGNSPLVALPIFPPRMFRHGFICINRKSGIRHPKDLEGKRIGVHFTQTVSVVTRGILQHDYGIDLSTIRWLQGSVDKPGRNLNPNIPEPQISLPLEYNDTGKSLGALLEEHAIDALFDARLPRALGTHPDIARLFPNFKQVERDYYGRTGIFPIMHLVAMRRDTYERHPHIASSLFKALQQSKELAERKLRAIGSLPYMLPWLAEDIAEIDEVFSGDPWPYGVEPNRKAIEQFVTFLVEQGLLPKPVAADDLFVPI